MKPRTVVSLEQALSLPSATLRFVQLGWRVIRVEATPRASGLPGDPNRYIGARVVDDDRRSYFLAPNVGKQSIALNLKDEAGRAALHRIIRELDADIFCCNTLPGRYKELGIDYETLCQHKPDIIWAGISAMGPEYPDIPGYDPAIQAMSGFMEVTGREDGPPTLSGIPLIDLKAGDEVYAGVCLALAERAETGKGKEIHVSMLQAAASWLITTLPLLDFNPDYSEVTRCGNEHRKFIPTNAYPTSDGHIYIAIGNDIQWRRFTDLAKFNSVASDARVTNEGRLADRYALYKDIGEITVRYTQAELAEDFKAAGIAHAPILDVPKVRQLPAVSSKLTTTRTPDGKTVHMQPPAVDIEGGATDFAFPAKYGQDTDSVLRECGLSDGDIRALAEGGSIYRQPGQ